MNWEMEGLPEVLPEEIAEPMEPSPPALSEEVLPGEPAPLPKARKPRAAKAGTKSTKPKTSRKRKAKEPAPASEIKEEPTA